MFTRLSNGWQAVLWDGEYELYSKLRYEPMFVGVLHNPDKRKEVLKLWDDTSNEWVDCEPGTYIARDEHGVFHSVTKEFVDERRLR
jgi:hypothetical protein